MSIAHRRPYEDTGRIRLRDLLVSNLIQLESVVELVIAWWRWKFTPFSHSFESGAIPVRGPRRKDMGAARALLVIMDQLGERMPFRAVCYQRAIAGQRMLRRRGFEAVIHYGVDLKRKQMKAHVWISVNGRFFISEEERKRWAEVMRHPAL